MPRAAGAMHAAGRRRRAAHAGGLRRGAAGAVAGPIVRPIDTPVAAGGAPVSDRDLLDAFRTPQATALTTWIEEAAKVTTRDVRDELEALVDATGALKLAPTPPLTTLAVSSADLLTRLAPDRTVVDAMRGRLSTGLIDFDVFAGD